MPYSKKKYGTKKKWRKYKRCVKEVVSKDGQYNPYAICRSSIYKKNKK
jgi:hypothetical protein